MRICFGLGALLGVVSGLNAASLLDPPRRVTLEVRADVRTGKLMRSTAVRPRVIPEKVITPRDPARAPAAIPESIPEAVQQAALRHDLDPLLVHSVIQVESNYNEYAISPKGAEGLMQLIPSTARRFGVRNAFDPYQNLSGGVRYLKYLMDLYNKDITLALAAYNAGEAAVARYNNRIPPYPETQDYVYQVAKKLGAAKRAAKASAAAKPVSKDPDEHRPIEKVVAQDGRVYYRTR